MADALRSGCDSIVTCGGIQSNHARATLYMYVTCTKHAKSTLLHHITVYADINTVIVLADNAVHTSTLLISIRYDTAWLSLQ